MTADYLHQKRHRLRKLRGETAYVDATAARLHVATLLGAGWSIRSIAATAGVAAATLSRLNLNKQAQASPETIRRILSVDPTTMATTTNRGGATPFVSRVGTVRRLQALMAMGYSHNDLAALGVDSRNLLNQQGRWITRARHDVVAGVYRQIASTPGPNPRAARWARSLGYPGPADWDDIDRDLEPTRDEVGEVAEVGYTLSEYRHLTSCGVSHAQACVQLGVTPDAISVALSREAS